MTSATRTILTYGTFDLFHVGHVRLLQRLSELGSRLVVGVSSDEFNAIKGKKCVMPFEDRATILRSCRYVSEVFAETCWEQKAWDVKRFNADVFAMGSDWTGKFDKLADFCKVVYLPRTEGVSTTDLKNIVVDRAMPANGYVEPRAAMA